MALISHADWLDRFGDAADDGAGDDLDSLRFEVAAVGSPGMPVPRPLRRARREHPLLAYRAGPPYRERRAEPRPAR